MIKRLTGFLLLTLLMFTGCALQTKYVPGSQEANLPALSPGGAVPMNEVASRPEDVFIATENGEYPAGVQDITLLWNNRTDREFIYGEEFALERETAGGWETLPMLEGAGFDDIAVVLSPNSTRAQKLQIKFAYGELPEGKYRVITQAKSKGDDACTLSAEFRVSAAATTSPVVLPAGIPDVSRLSEKDVLFIARGDIAAPDAVWATNEAVCDMLSYLQALRLTAYLGDKPAQEKTGEQFTVVCFDGRRIAVDIFDDALSFGEGVYAYDAPAAGLPEQSVSLLMEKSLWPAGIEEINFAIVNSTADTVPVVLAPMLERAAKTGWEKLRIEGGFCGTPDPIQPGRYETTVPMQFLYPEADEGAYRLTLSAYAPDGSTYLLSTVFAIGGEGAL